MAMIYFGGYRLDWDESQVPGDHLPDYPVIIRGYDKTGNLLSEIRDWDLIQGTPTRVTIPSTPPVDVAGLIFEGTDVYGVQRIMHWYDIEQAGATAPRHFPCSLAAKKNGWVLAAMGAISVPYDAAGLPSGTSGFVCQDFFRVYRRGGGRVDFPQLHGGQILCVRLDAAENIFVGGFAAGGYVARKYDPEGALLWSVEKAYFPNPDYSNPDNLNVVLDIAIDGDGNSYLLEASASWVRHIRKFDPDGVEIWSFVCYCDLLSFYSPDTRSRQQVTRNQIIVGGDYVAVLCYSTAYYTKNGAGEYQTASYPDAYNIVLILDKDTGDYVKRVVPYASGYSIAAIGYVDNQPAPGSSPRVCIVRPSAYGTYYRQYYLSSNEETFGASLSACGSYRCYPSDVAMDEDQTLYIAGKRKCYTGTPQTLKHFNAIRSTTTDGYELGGLEAAPGQSAADWSVASVAVVQNSQTPPLPLWLGAALPTWIGDTYISPPGLPLGIGLGEAESQWDYVGDLRLPDVYRAYLTGSPPLGLPISSVQIRRDTERCTVSLVSPSPSVDLMAGIAARRVGGALEVYRGIRFADGREQLARLLSVPLTDVRNDLGASSRSLTLTGYGANPAHISRSRVVRGISYRAYYDGKRRVRCALDTYLSPGDTALLGGVEVLTVAEMTYSISASSAVMEISE